MQDSIFREKSLKRISSPDQLNDYIKVSNPSVWLLLGALTIILVAGFIWAISGNITSKVDATGVFQDIDNKPGVETVTCFVGVNDAQKLAVGMETRLYNPYKSTNNYVVGKVQKIFQVPLKQEEILKDYSSEWIADNILQTGYGVAVTISVMQNENSNDGLMWSNGTKNQDDNITIDDLCRVEIITESISPIDFLLGKGA